jgi:hypothetical protein
MRILFRYLVLTMGVFMAAQSLAADDAPTMTYLHLFSDSAGVSHFKEGRMTFSPARAGGPLALPLPNTEGATFLRLKSGAVEDWHKAPRRWFLIAVQGVSEVTASDGQVRRLTPGMIMLMDDTTGKGHITRAIGPEDHVAIVVPVDEIP